MQTKEGMRDVSWKGSVAWFLLCALAIFALYLSKSILSPFIIALLLAYAFDPVIDVLEERQVPRTLAIGSVFILITIVLALFLFFGLPTLQDQMMQAFEQFPVYLEHLRKNLLPAIESTLGIQLPSTFDETLKTILPRLKEDAPALFKPVTTFALSFFTNTFGLVAAVANLIIIPFMFYYLLRDFDRIKTSLARFIPDRYHTEVYKRLREIDLSLSGFVRGQLLIILLLCVFYVAGLSIIGLDIAFMLGIIAAIGEVVPYVGFAVGLVLSLAFAFLQFQDLIQPLYVLALFGGIQAIQGLAIAPLIMGKQVGLHPLVIIASIYIAGDLFGFIGILLAVPGAAVLVVLLRAFSEYYRNSNLYLGKS